jgi:hypothetical protein
MMDRRRQGPADLSAVACDADRDRRQADNLPWWTAICASKWPSRQALLVLQQRIGEQIGLRPQPAAIEISRLPHVVMRRGKAFLQPIQNSLP